MRAQTVAGYGQANAVGPTNAPPESGSFLSGIAGEISIAASDIRDMEMRVRSIADSVFGSQPETVGSPNGAGKTPTSGFADDIRDRLHILTESINGLRSQINRLGTL